MLLLFDLMMEVKYSSEMLIPTYRTKGCHKPEDHNVSYLEI